MEGEDIPITFLTLTRNTVLTTILAMKIVVVLTTFLIHYSEYTLSMPPAHPQRRTRPKPQIQMKAMRLLTASAEITILILKVSRTPSQVWGQSADCRYVLPLRPFPRDFILAGLPSGDPGSHRHDLASNTMQQEQGVLADDLDEAWT